jgi:hypothetical protein
VNSFYAQFRIVHVETTTAGGGPKVLESLNFPTQRSTDFFDGKCCPLSLLIVAFD